MKLYYFRDTGGLRNFGDDLNEWLWPQLIPDLLDEDEEVTLVGIGTLLNERIHQRLSPTCRRIIVFSSGVGYGSATPSIDKRWKIYCLRGPLSAKALGVSEGLALTDGAMLVRCTYSASVAKQYRFSYMPHVLHAKAAAGGWDRLCHEIGFGYVDARWPVDKVLNAISSTEVLVTEAMHGAIVADALRVPWIPIRSTASILAFKWHDWCMSVGVAYEPKHICPLWKPPQGGNRARSLRNWAKRKVIEAQLLRICATVRPCLSRLSRTEELIQRLREKLEQVRRDAPFARNRARPRE